MSGLGSLSRGRNTNSQNAISVHNDNTDNSSDDDLIINKISKARSTNQTNGTFPKARSTDLTASTIPKAIRSTEEALNEFRSKFSKETKPKLGKPKTKVKLPSTFAVAGTSAGSAVKLIKPRRGRTKKTDVEDNLLFAMSEAERGVLLSERASIILDINETKTAELRRPYKLSNTVDIMLSSGSNDRLDAYRDKDHQLWKMSTEPECLPTEKFYTSVLKDKMQSFVDKGSVEYYQNELIEAEVDTESSSSSNEIMYDSNNSSSSSVGSSQESQDNLLKKQSRSVSPLRSILLNDCSYTVPEQANKKYKADDVVDTSGNMRPIAEEQPSIIVLNEFDRKSLPNNVLSDIFTPPCAPYKHNVPLSKFVPSPISRHSNSNSFTRKHREKLRENSQNNDRIVLLSQSSKTNNLNASPNPNFPISTPPYYSQNDHIIPLNDDNYDDNVLNFEQERNSNDFAWNNNDTDDSLFANIPENILDSHPSNPHVQLSPELSPIVPISPVPIVNKPKNAKSKSKKVNPNVDNVTKFASSSQFLQQRSITFENNLAKFTTAGGNCQSTPTSVAQSQPTGRRGCNTNSQNAISVHNDNSSDDDLIINKISKTRSTNQTTGTFPKARSTDLTASTIPKAIRSTEEALNEFRSKFSKETKPKLGKPKTKLKLPSTYAVAGTSAGSAVKLIKPRRGRTKKTDVEDNLLFAMSEAERGVLLSERASIILDINETKIVELRRPYKLSNTMDIMLSSGSNDRLDAYRDKDHQLWKMSTEPECLPNEKFYTSVLKDKMQSIVDKGSVEYYQNELIEAEVDTESSSSSNEIMYDSNNSSSSSVGSSQGSQDNLLKKRSRSVSPLRSILLNDCSYTVPDQANKKYKADDSVDISGNMRPIAEEQPSIIVLNEFDRKSLPNNVLSDIFTPPCAPYKHNVPLSNFVQSPISRHSNSNSFTRKHREKLRENSQINGRILLLSQSSKTKNLNASPNPNFPISTPPYYSQNDHIIPLNDDNYDDDNVLNFEQDRNSNDFAWNNNDTDDSLFANIPEYILDSHPSNPHVELSPELSPIVPISPVPIVNKPKKAKSKSKKANPNVDNVTKFTSSSQPLQQRSNTFENNLAKFTTAGGNCQSTPTSLAQSQPTGRRGQAAQNQCNQSPLLNYSTIDTPILKQELKKYGLKVLPRSKAKLLLRHIYKETH